MEITIINRGFELLKTRALDEKVNLEELEVQNDIVLPEKYRMFITMFDGINTEGNGFKYLNVVEDRLFPCAEILYYPTSYKIGNDDIVKLVDFVHYSKVFDLYVDDWQEEGYLLIGSVDHEGGILLGTRGQEKDKIIIDYHDNYTVLADNIFDFVRDLVAYIPKEGKLFGGIDFSQLYKNWGENFWRVKPSSI